MNLKYYLRGLGIGTIVTALILGIALGNSKDQMSNEEIKQKAKELEMVEQTGVLTDGVEESTPEDFPETEDRKSVV